MTKHVLRLSVIFAATAILLMGLGKTTISQEPGKPEVATAGNGTGSPSGGDVLGDDGKPLSVTLETMGYPVLLLAQLSNVTGRDHAPFEGIFSLVGDGIDLSRSVTGTMGSGKNGSKLDVCLIAIDRPTAGKHTYKVTWGPHRNAGSPDIFTGGVGPKTRKLIAIEIPNACIGNDLTAAVLETGKELASLREETKSLREKCDQMRKALLLLNNSAVREQLESTPVGEKKSDGRR